MKIEVFVKNKIVSARLYPAKNQLKMATVFSLPTEAFPLMMMMESKSLSCFLINVILPLTKFQEVSEHEHKIFMVQL